MYLCRTYDVRHNMHVALYVVHYWLNAICSITNNPTYIICILYRIRKFVGDKNIGVEYKITKLIYNVNT